FGRVQIFDAVIESGALKPTYVVPLAASSSKRTSPVLPAAAPNGSQTSSATVDGFKSKISFGHRFPIASFPFGCRRIYSADAVPPVCCPITMAGVQALLVDTASI